MNKEKINNRITRTYCSISESESGKEIQCDSKCRRKAILGLSGSGVMFITSLGFGYLIEPSVLKITWLVIMGAMVIMTGISIYLLILKTGKETNDQVEKK